ncbi:MAG: methyltransferase domain-containing protein [Planctomycetota bacterium]|nr:MAG: methyltransferase domain-containing protein [Planctomycetota bacterium]
MSPHDGLPTAEKEPAEPDPFFLKALALVEQQGRGTAVDVACGRGRHALELARRGWRVEAWDLSTVALEQLRAAAARAQLHVDTRALELTASMLPPDRQFDLVVVVNFLDRELLAAMRRLVAGHLILATYTSDWPGEHPSPRWRLRRGELAAGLPGFQTRLYEEQGGRAGLLCR